MKKSRLYASLWESCDELRGGMDATEYKNYVLTLLFVKYVSDRAASGETLLDVPEGTGFDALLKARGKPDVGEQVDKALSALAEANDLQGVLDEASFNDPRKFGDGKKRQATVSALIGIFADLNFRANRAGGDDLLGDAYEYLMRHFATESGKSKGQFYTPAEVSRLLADLLRVEEASGMDQPTAYDPTCGSGSLLIKAADAVGTGKLALYGQESDNQTYALARMNMILHGQDTAELQQGNTLANPAFEENTTAVKRFDFVVANPPFSVKSWADHIEPDPENDRYGRFKLGTPPPKNGDYAFLLHILASLKDTGRAAVILPHGVLFRGNKEGVIRKKLLERGYIEAVIGLPPNLFYGTGIPACVLMLNRDRAEKRKTVFLVDASGGFLKDGAKNRLRARDVHRIADAVATRADVAGFCRDVPLEEIGSEKNGFNLNLPRYIDTAAPEDLHDLDGHLNGGIPVRDVDKLSHFWDAMPGLREALFEPLRDGYLKAKLPPGDVRAAVLGHPAFAKRQAEAFDALTRWESEYRERLTTLGPDERPKQLIEVLTEGMLAAFEDAALVDKYDVFQRLMGYWVDQMQDDAYAVITEGWKKAAQPRPVELNKKDKPVEDPDLLTGTGRSRKKWKMDLLPPQLLIADRFSVDAEALADAEAKAENAAAELAEYVEEMDDEDDLLEQGRGASGKVTAAALRSRISAIGRDPEFAEEKEALERCAELLSRAAAAKGAAKLLSDALDEGVFKEYPKLSTEEIIGLVVEGKWFGFLRAAVAAELDAAGGRLAGRVRELEERYAETLGELEAVVEAANLSVAKSLKQMRAAG